MRRTAAALAGLVVASWAVLASGPVAQAATSATPDLAAVGDARAKANGMDTVWRETVQAALAGKKCPTTALGTFVNAKLKGADPADLATLSKYDGLDVPFYQALLEKDGTPQTIGYGGSLTKPLTRELTKLDGFWDAPTSSPGLFGVHGDVLTSVSGTARVYRLAFGLKPAQAKAVAKQVVAAATDLPHGGAQNPILTLNAISFPDEPGITNRIIFGDGIGGFFANTSFNRDDVGNEYVLAHEFGHQVQFALKIPTDESTAKKSRKVEMMADAYGSYFMANRKGEGLNHADQQIVNRSAYVAGDCAVTEAGHHGTPPERAAASRWASGLYHHQKDPSKILDPRVVEKKFLKALPGLIAVDDGGGPAYG